MSQFVRLENKCKQATFLRLFGFMRGFEGVQKSGTERLRVRIGVAVRTREVLKWRISELPQELGLTYLFKVA